MRPARFGLSPSTSAGTHLAVWGALALAACGTPAGTPDAGPVPTPPSGVTCAHLEIANTEGALQRALGGAAAGDCVFAATGTYDGGFRVPSGVTLFSSPGAPARFFGNDSQGAALSLSGGERSGLYDVEVAGSAGDGIGIEASPATLSHVSVKGSNRGVVATCPGGAACAGSVTLKALTSSHNRVGLLVAALTVTLANSAVRGNVGMNLADGTGVIVNGGGQLTVTDVVIEGNGSAGLIVNGGGQLTVTDVVIEGNGSAGLIVDGSQGRTTVTATRATVRQNDGVGVAAQSLGGTVADPWLVIDDSLLEENAGFGLRLVSSRGASVKNTTVRATRSQMVATGVGQLARIGDGVALLHGSGEVRLDGVTLTGNPRCQALVHDGRDNISIVNSVVATDGGLYLVVVQGSAPVDVPAELVSDAGTTLPVP